MSNFTLISSGIHTAAAMAEIDARPDLWNARDNRRDGLSPHRETDDMWIRYRDPAELHAQADYAGPHDSIWYPAWHALPALHPIFFHVASIVRPVRSGGVLITRVPPGGNVYPHHDQGTWHAHHYDQKVWIPLRANDQCVNTVEDEAMVWKTGEAWQHDNLKVHSVHNGGETERVCLILCFRCEDA